MRACHLFPFILLLASAPWCGAALVTVESESARPFGYVIGDEIPLVTTLRLPAACRVLPDSLPKPGAVEYWLNLKQASLRVSVGHSVRVERIYQSFYAPLEVKTLRIPALSLLAHCGAEKSVVELPPWEFSAAPLRGLRVEGEQTLRPDRRPSLPAIVPDAVGLVLSLGLALACAARWSWLAGRLPRAGAFARARAELRRLGTEPWDGAVLAQACAIAHRAFNRYAGQPVFADRLDAFLADHPAWQAQEEELREFFAFSYALHFGAESDGVEWYPPARLRALVDACARLEMQA